MRDAQGTKLYTSASCGALMLREAAAQPQWRTTLTSDIVLIQEHHMHEDYMMWRKADTARNEQLNLQKLPACDALRPAFREGIIDEGR